MEISTKFKQFYAEEPWVEEAKIAFRDEVEKRVSSVTFLNWASGRVEPDPFKHEWLDDLFEKYSYRHIRPYGTSHG